jgi:hypothetical protein
MTHSAEDLCEYVMRKHGMTETFLHADVRHGFIFSFQEKPELKMTLDEVEQEVNQMIAQDLPISFQDDMHIRIGEESWLCHGPRMHVRSTGEIKEFTLNKEFLTEPLTGRFLLVGVVGDQGNQKLSDLNKIGPERALFEALGAPGAPGAPGGGLHEALGAPGGGLHEALGGQ